MWVSFRHTVCWLWCWQGAPLTAPQSHVGSPSCLRSLLRWRSKNQRSFSCQALSASCKTFVSLQWIFWFCFLHPTSFFFFFDILQQAFFYLPVSPFLYFFKWGQPTKAVPKVQGGMACRQALCGCSQHHPICSPISFQSWLERDAGSQCCQVVLRSHSASSPVQAKHIVGIHIKARISIGWAWLAGVLY